MFLVHQRDRGVLFFLAVAHVACAPLSVCANDRHADRYSAQDSNDPNLRIFADLDTIESDLGLLISRVGKLEEGVRELEEVRLSQIGEQARANRRGLRKLSEEVTPLRDHMGIFLGIMRFGLALFAILVTVGMFLWQRGLRQVFLTRADTLGDDVSRRIDDICEFQNTLYRGFGVAALESLLGDIPENLRLRDCFSASMLVLSLKPHNVFSGCLNLREFHRRKVQQTSIARPVLRTSLKNWTERLAKARTQKEKKTIRGVIQELERTIKELSKAP